MTTATTTASWNVGLVLARVLAGLYGASQLAGIVFFVFIAPQEAVWLGPWIDVPIVAVMVGGALLKLGVAVLPRLPAARRISMGFIAVAMGIAVTLVKIPAYQEPEGVIALAIDGVLLALLAVAWRTARRRQDDVAQARSTAT